MAIAGTTEITDSTPLTGSAPHALTSTYPSFQAGTYRPAVAVRGRLRTKPKRGPRAEHIRRQPVQSISGRNVHGRPPATGRWRPAGLATPVVRRWSMRKASERPPATPASLLAAHHVPAQANATPQDTPHYFADTRGIYWTAQLATGSERRAGAAMRRPLAVSVQHRRKGELNERGGTAGDVRGATIAANLPALI